MPNPFTCPPKWIQREKTFHIRRQSTREEDIWPFFDKKHYGWNTHWTSVWISLPPTDTSRLVIWREILLNHTCTSLIVTRSFTKKKTVFDPNDSIAFYPCIIFRDVSREWITIIWKLSYWTLVRSWHIYPSYSIICNSAVISTKTSWDKYLRSLHDQIRQYVRLLTSPLIIDRSTFWNRKVLLFQFLRCPTWPCSYWSLDFRLSL